MTALRWNFTVLVFTLTAALGTACGGNASMSSPVGPSSSSGGASISGTINGAPVATRSLDPGGLSLLDTRGGVTITIVGTGISTSANNQGQFALDNVPTGTVQLNFTGPGSNATVTLTGVGPGDKVQITVTVNGNNAHVDSEHHSSPGNGTREFQGRIVTLDATAKSFTTSGLTVKTTDTTIIRHGNRVLTFTDLTIGDHVEVRGTMDGATITATEVQVETDEDDDQGEDDNHQGGQAEILATRVELDD